MIRIVDLFNKTGRYGQLPSQPEPVPAPTPPPQPSLPPQPSPPLQAVPPSQKLSVQEVNKLLDDLIVTLKFLADLQTPPAEAAKKVEPLLAELGTVVDQQILGNPGILPALDRCPDEPVYARALKKAVRSVNIALDANYQPDQLKEIALAALLSGVEAGSSGGEFSRLSGLVGRRIKLDEAACRNILNLAELYENIAQPGA